MDIDRFRAKTQTYLDTLSDRPNHLHRPGTKEGVAVPMPRLEIAGMRETPDVILFSYQAAIDTDTGEREEMGGNLPIAVDRRTGGVDTTEMMVLAEFWPGTIGADAARMVLAAHRAR